MSRHQLWIILIIGLGLGLSGLAAASTPNVGASEKSAATGSEILSDDLDAEWELWFQLVGVWGQSGNGPGQFSGLRDVGVDPSSGFLYVTETDNHRVQILGLDGQHVGGWGTLGGDRGQFVRPTALVVDRFGRVYVVDKGNDRVQVFSLEGELLGLWEAPRPRDIALGPDGNLYLLCQGEDALVGEISVYTPQGTFRRRLAVKDEFGRAINPAQISISAGGILYATDLYRYRIVALDLEGNYQFQWHFQRGPVTGIGISPDGLFYASEPTTGTHVHTLQGMHLERIPVNGAVSVAATGGNPAFIYLVAGNRIHVYRQHIRRARPHLVLPLLIKPPLATPTPLPTATWTGSPSAGTPSATPTYWSDTYEPNDDFDQAAGPLRLGEMIFSYIWSHDDQDIYFFRVSDVEPFHIALGGGPPDGDYDLYLYDAGRQRLAESEQLGTQEQISWTPRQTGKYYVLVRPYNRTSGRYHAYWLRVSHQATPTVPSMASPTPTDRHPYPGPRTATPTATATRPLPTARPSRTPTLTVTPTRTVLASGQDLGDAPDSSNRLGIAMEAYPDVWAGFPTSQEAPPYGPLHHNEVKLFYLGHQLTEEEAAEYGYDQDGVNNILPAQGQANLDGGDDGLLLPSRFTHNRRHRLNFTVTILPDAPKSAYVNVWIDWNRNGRWGDAPFYAGWHIPEWAVQNQVVTLDGPGLRSFATSEFMAYNLQPLKSLWVRITISERPTDTDNGAGPRYGYGWGETEDYLLPGVAPVTPTPTPRR